jgi:hypothetical protein
VPFAALIDINIWKPITMVLALKHLLYLTKRRRRKRLFL